MVWYQVNLRDPAAAATDDPAPCEGVTFWVGGAVPDEEPGEVSFTAAELVQLARSAKAWLAAEAAAASMSPPVVGVARQALACEACYWGLPIKYRGEQNVRHPVPPGRYQCPLCNHPWEVPGP